MDRWHATSRAAAPVVGSTNDREHGLNVASNLASSRSRVGITIVTSRGPRTTAHRDLPELLAQRARGAGVFCRRLRAPMWGRRVPRHEGLLAGPALRRARDGAARLGPQTVHGAPLPPPDHYRDRRRREHRIAAARALLTERVPAALGAG